MIQTSEKHPKLLFVTVNGWNNTTGTSTISSIIEGYPKECIANIFLRADMPNSNVCDNYFRIDELKVLRSIIKRNVKTGFVIKKDNTQEIDFNSEHNRQVKLKSKKNELTPFIRDFVWKVGAWKTNELKKFVFDFNPDIIVFPAEGLIHFNNIGLYLSNLLKKPIGLFFWDDNFTYKPVNGFFNKLYRCLQRCNIKKLAKKASFAFSLNKKMQKECLSELGIQSVLLTRPIISNVENKPYKYSGGVIKILYTGSIYIGRGETILELIEAIKKVNDDGNKFFLEIYTNSFLTKEEKLKYNVDGVSAILPPVTKEEVIKLQNETDILLFVEAIRGEFKNAARLSFSTKITDYLSARKCILALGPQDIAPMEYFRNNDIALVANQKEELENILIQITRKPQIMEKYAERSYNYGIENHNKEITYKTFQNTVTGLWDEIRGT